MARTTTYYGLNISEGNDPVNPLVDIFPNFEDLDSDLKDVSDAAVGTATELTTGTVHALTRSDTDRDVFLFVATSNFEAGETFTLDGVQVTVLTPDGQPLATGSYVIGSVVLCALQSTLLTVYVNPAKAKDSDKLDGQHGSYYATASDVTDLGDTVTAISNKVGSAVLTTTAPDCSGAINELNSNLSNLQLTYVSVMSLSNTSNHIDIMGDVSALFVELINPSGICIDSSPLLSEVTLQFHNSSNNTWREVQLSRTSISGGLRVGITSTANVSDCTVRVHKISG